MQKDSIQFTHCLKMLKQSPLFGSVSDDLLEDMLSVPQYKTYKKGKMVTSPQQVTDHIYIIVNGRAKVSAYNPDSGREYIMFLFDTGDVFDVISLLDGKWQNSTMTALDNMEIVLISVSHAREWIDQHPDFNKAFLPYLGKQLRTLANQATDITLYDTEVRLARLIVNNLSPDTPNQGDSLINNLSQETLASMIGSVRVVVARHLQGWKKDNIITSNHGHWSVTDLQALLSKAKDQ